MDTIALRIALIEFIFSKADEPQISYGAACLKAAFDASKHKMPDDTIKILSYNLEVFKTGGAYDINRPVLLGKIWEDLQSFRPTVIAFSVFAWSDSLVREMGAQLPTQRSGDKPFVLLGGPMICGDESELQNKYPFGDCFVISYGEKVFSNMRAYINSQPVVHDSPALSDLNSPYLLGVIPVRQGMAVRMETHRGCSYRCPFCRHSGGMNPIQAVGTEQRFREELVLFRDNNISKINVLNPLFNNKEDYKVLLDLVKELHIEIPLSVQIRCEALTDDFLHTIKEVPNIICEIGVQSLSSSVCQEIGRNPEKTLQGLRELQRNSINCEVSLIYGLPRQNFQDFEQDIRQLKEMGISKISAFPLQIYPGTKFFQEQEKLPLRFKPNTLGILEVDQTQDFQRMKALAEKMTS